MLPLTEAQSHFLEAEVEPEALGWVEYCLQRSEPTPLCSSGADPSWAPAVHLPKVFVSPCSWKEEPHGDNCKGCKVAPQFCTSGGKIERWTGDMTQLLSLLSRKSKEKGKSTAPLAAGCLWCMLTLLKVVPLAGNTGTASNRLPATYPPGRGECVKGRPGKRDWRRQRAQRPQAGQRGVIR